MNTGIYIIRCLVNNKIYIGSTLRAFNLRWNTHKYQLRNNLHANCFLQNAWNKYKEHNFVFEILEESDLSSKLLESLENWWVNMLDSKNKKIGYNIKTPERNATMGIDSRKRMSKAQLGKKMSISFCIKNSERMKNNKYGLGISPSEETRKKLSIANIGKKMSEEYLITKRKSVIQFDLNGNYIKNWDSPTTAATCLNLHKSHIYACCADKRKTAGKFKWKYS